MKSNILIRAIIISSLCLIALPGGAQTTGGGASVGAGASGSVGAPGAAAGAGVSGKASAQTGASTQTGAQQQTKGGLGASAGGNADVNASSSSGSAQNNQQQNNQQFTATNASPDYQTPLNTNVDGFPPGRPLQPTSQSGATNSVYATNSTTATNTSLQRDQAITEQDRAMLMQMRQAVFQGQPTIGWMNSIHFILKDGAVRIVGTVPSVAERQRIETIVTQIPGVVKVYDAVAVNASAGAEAGPANASVNANVGAGLPPTSFTAPNNGAGIPNAAVTNRIQETNAPPR